jgi:hypothetical protein
MNASEIFEELQTRVQQVSLHCLHVNVLRHLTALEIENLHVLQRLEQGGIR